MFLEFLRKFHYSFLFQAAFVADAEDGSVVEGVDKSICEEVAGVLHDEYGFEFLFL